MIVFNILILSDVNPGSSQVDPPALPTDFFSPVGDSPGRWCLGDLPVAKPGSAGVNGDGPVNGGSRVAPPLLLYSSSLGGVVCVGIA